jgi:hypothetical protein
MRGVRMRARVQHAAWAAVVVDGHHQHVMTIAVFRGTRIPSHQESPHEL